MSGTTEMLQKPFDRAIDIFMSHTEVRYWLLQFMGWAGFCLISFFTLTVWYESVRFEHVSHTIVEAMLGMVLTVPLRYVANRTSENSILVFILVNIAAFLSLAYVWTLLRMQTFLWMAHEYDIWEDFGGWFFGSIMVFGVWISLYHGVKYFFYFQAERARKNAFLAQAREEKIRRLTAENEARRTRLEVLRHRDNPHFLFNALNSVSALVNLGRSDEATAMINDLSRLLRFSLDTDALDDIALTQEVELATLYVDMHRPTLRHGINLTTAISQPAAKQSVPNLILLPLVENAIKHRARGMEAALDIIIRAKLSAGKLRIVVENSGQVDRKALDIMNGATPSKGIGITNLRDRLTSIYGNRAHLTARRSQLGGPQVIIEIERD